MSNHRNRLIIIKKARKELSDGVNEGKQFKPEMMPIGPYHRRTCESQFPDVKKKRVADEIFRLVGAQVLKSELRKILETSKGDAIKACYPYYLNKPPEEFLEVLLRDGCNVLDVLVDYDDVPGREKSDGTVRESSVMMNIEYLLRNQIRDLSVLEKMHGCIVPDVNSSKLGRDLAERVQRHLERLRSSNSGSQLSLPSRDPGSSYLLHLVCDYLGRRQMEDLPPPSGTSIASSSNSIQNASSTASEGINDGQAAGGVDARGLSPRSEHISGSSSIPQNNDVPIYPPVSRLKSTEEICRLVGQRVVTTKMGADLVARAKTCYTDLPSMTPEEFISMLLHDGCYLLGSFLVGYGNNARTKENLSAMRDILFLVENQIPWFILQEMDTCISGLLYPTNNSAAGNPPTTLQATRVRQVLTSMLFISPRRELEQLQSRTRSSTPSHLLHVVHQYLAPPGDPLQPSSREHRVDCCPGRRPQRAQQEGAMYRWRRATEYCRYANVELKPSEFKDGGVADSVLDVRLRGGTLWIPILLVDRLTCTILRNLMALEEQMDERPVTAYCAFMSQVACKVEDVEYLQRAGILQHFLANDDDVVREFGNLCKDVELNFKDANVNYLMATWHELQRQCQNTTNNCVGTFIQTYCFNSVRTSAFVITVVLFLFQAAQVVLAALQLKNR